MEENSNIIIGMLIEQKEVMKSLEKKIPIQQNTSSQVDVQKVEQLAFRMRDSIVKMDGVIKQARQPVIRETKFRISIDSKGVLFSLIALIGIIVVLIGVLVFSIHIDNCKKDSDLKYRYIRMKGEAAPELVLRLESFFGDNRDEDKIRHMRKVVERYERMVHDGAVALERDRLRALEVERLEGVFVFGE